MMDKLKKCEMKFLMDHPMGFDDVSLKDINKRHNFSKMATLTQESMVEENFKNRDLIIERILEIVTKSSLISRFNKPKFKTFINSMTHFERELLVDGYHMILYGDEERGFNQVLEIYRTYKVAGWPVMSIIQAYFKPNDNVFIKPTTVKNIIKYFEIVSITYNAKPTYDFYNTFRDIINEMKMNVEPSLYPSNAAFTGFLMMTMEI